MALKKRKDCKYRLKSPFLTQKKTKKAIMGCIKIHLQKVYLIVPSKTKYAKKKGSFQIEDLKQRLILPVKIWDL